ncbi:HAD family hydrolase [uncultured Lentibacter sp.]|uniref:HAD family hydrolase n=1 Tax=uncultured Lentibacter sp. TaxID=1659309 RepID=UPI0026364DEC|nr:HAD family hydrolase [uncultured Lentibacter sp.]
MSAIEAIVFDKDGTLFDFARTWEAWAVAFLRRLARDEAHAREMAQAVGFDYDSQHFKAESIVIAGMPSEIAQALAPHLPQMGQAALVAVLNEEAGKAPQAEAVPLRPLLARLRAAGLKLGVATNDAQAPALAHLESAGVATAFDFVAGFDSGYGGKPAPGQLLAFCQAVGVAPSAAVMVGDSTHDLRAGAAAGMRRVAVLTGLADAATLAPLADVVLPDIGHLPDWLGL